jgi:hypothetical protein
MGHLKPRLVIDWRGREVRTKMCEIPINVIFKQEGYRMIELDGYYLIQGNGEEICFGYEEDAWKYLNEIGLIDLMRDPS